MLSCNALEENASLRGTKADETTAELIETKDDVPDTIGERRLMNFWTLLIQTIHHPCLPHLRAHGHCDDGHSNNSGGGGSGGGGSGGVSQTEP